MKRLILSIFLFFIPTGQTHAAVALVGTESVFNFGGTLSSLTLTLTVSSGTNRALVCAAVWSAAQTITSVVWDAAGANQAFTAIPSTHTVGSVKVQAWQLVNPTPGTTKLVTITMTASTDNIYAGCGHFSGVDQTTPVRAGSFGTDTDTNITVTATAGDATFTTLATSGTVTATNQTSIGMNSSLSTWSAGVDYALASGNVTHTWTGTGATQAIIGFAIAQSSGGVVASPRRRPIIFR